MFILLLSKNLQLIPISSDKKHTKVNIKGKPICYALKNNRKRIPVSFIFVDFFPKMACNKRNTTLVYRTKKFIGLNLVKTGELTRRVRSPALTSFVQ